MIKSTKGISLRFFQANKFLAISSIISITLAIFLIITMVVFSQNTKQSLANEMKQLFGDMDLSVGYNPEQNKQLRASFIEDVTRLEAVQQTSPVLISHLRLEELNTILYTLGVENDDLVKSRYHFSKDMGDTEIILNESLATALDLKVGDVIHIENAPFTVVETLNELGWSGITTDMMILPRSVVKTIIHEQQHKDYEALYVLIKAKNKANIPLLANTIKEFDSELRIDITEENEYVVANLQSLNVFLIVLSMLILIVSSLFINSNMDAFVYKYRNQMAIMRSLGATREQLFKMIWYQCSLMNVSGGLLGFCLAIIGHRAIESWMSALFSIDSNPLPFNYGSAIVVTIITMAIIQLFMCIPANRSSKILPMKLIADNENNDFTHKRIGKGLGIVCLSISAFCIIVGFIAKLNGSDAIFFLLASLLLIFGLFRLFPIYLSNILTIMTPIIRKLLGNLSFVAINNLIPQVKKNTTVILTISTMMIITVFGSSLFETIGKNEQDYLKIQYITDIVITSRTGFDSAFDRNMLAQSVTELTGIEEMSTLSSGIEEYFKIDGQFVPMNYSLIGMKEMEEQGIIKSQIDVNPSESMIITQKMADRFQLSVGDRVELGKYSIEQQSRVSAGSSIVTAIYEKLPGSYYDVYFDWDNNEMKQANNVFYRMYINSSDQANTLKQLEELQRMYPAQLQVSSYKQAVEKANEMLMQRWSIFIVVLVIILLSVMMGVCNTLIQNIHSKRKEFATLRILSVTERGIAYIIWIQVTLYILIGIIFGLVTGMLATYILSLVDLKGGVHIHFQYVGYVSLIMLVVAYVIILPITHSMRKRSLISELTRDNK